MAKSTTIALVAIVVVIVFVVAVYAALTYPRTIVSVPVSFTVGVDSKEAVFDQPFLSDKIEVEVSVQSGTSLWRAQILNATQILWEHAASQGEQTNYNSGWIDLPTGTYNFEFATLGVGSLDAKATVSSKGGFW